MVDSRCGLALLETVEDDREHPNFKLLLAPLYNSRLKVKARVSKNATFWIYFFTQFLHEEIV